MKEQKNHIHYSAEDIRKYLDGELSHAEMQAIEKAALDDPFLADTMEGLEESRKQPGSFEAAITELNNRLSARIQEKNQKPGLLILFSGWRIAAAILFLLGVTLFTYKYITRITRGEIAKTIEKDSLKKIPIPAVRTPDGSAHASSTAAPVNLPAVNAERKSTRTGDARKSLSKNKVVIPYPDQSKTATDKEDETAKNSVADSGSAYRKNVAGSFMAAEAKPESDSSVTNTNQMKSNPAALNEVVALGYGNAAKKRKTTAFSETDSLEMTKQLIGWDAFLGYIYSNKKIISTDSLLRGEEVISFVIDRHGKLSAFHVERSISPAHDDELKQLIQTAPGLKLRSGKKLRVQVRIWF